MIFGATSIGIFIVNLYYLGLCAFVAFFINMITINLYVLARLLFLIFLCERNNATDYVTSI